MRRPDLCAVLFLLILLFSSSADELVLQNGDKVTGTIISMDENKVVVETPYGILEIDRKYIRSGTFLSEETAAASEIAKASPVREGLLMEYLFQGNLRDSAGKNSLLINTGNVLFYTGADKKENSAVLSGGDGSFLSLNTSEDINNLQSFTLCFWTLISDMAKLQYLLSKWDTAGKDSAAGKFTLSIFNGVLSLYLVDSKGKYHNVKVQEAVKLNTWHFIVIRFENGILDIYIDTENRNRAEMGFNTLLYDRSPLYIFTAKANTDNPWSYYNTLGAMDNLRLYNRGLSEEEIITLYEELVP